MRNEVTDNIRMVEKRMLGNNLKQAREASPYTQEEIAQVLETKRQTYSAYERGVSIPDALTLKTLAGLFGVSIDSLLNNTSSPDCFTEYYRIIFSENLMESLASLGKTQKDLATDLELQASKVTDFCKGRKMPSNMIMDKLALYLHITPWELLEEKETLDSYKEQDVLKVIGERVHTRRMMLNITGADLVRRLGADLPNSRSLVDSIEHGLISHITPRKLDALAKALCTTSQYLLGETTEFSKKEMSLAETEMNLLTHYRKLNKENQNALIKYIDFLLSNQ